MQFHHKVKPISLEEYFKINHTVQNRFSRFQIKLSHLKEVYLLANVSRRKSNMNVPCTKGTGKAQLLRKGRPRALSECTTSDEVWNATSLGSNKTRLNEVLHEATKRTVQKDSIIYLTSDFSGHIDQINNIEDIIRKKKHLREKLLCEVSVLRKDLDQLASSKEGTMDFLMRRHSLQRQSSTRSSISSKEYPQELTMPSTSCKEGKSLHDTKDRRRNSLESGNKRFLVIDSNSTKLCPSAVQEPNTSFEFEKEKYITRNNCASDTHQSFDITAKQIALVSTEEKIHELEEELAEHFKI